MRNAFVKELSVLAREDQNVIAVLADNGLLVFDDFQKLFPKQFLNVGIAESNMVGFSAGLASTGFVPFVYTILPFITFRAFEFVRDDICYQKQNVKLVGIGAGFSYSTLGPTHHGTEDIAMTRSLPGLTIYSPADPLETEKVTLAAYKTVGPVYIRIGKGKDPVVYNESYEFLSGKGVVLREGKDLTFIGTGSILADALLAAELLEKEGIQARVINIHTIKPLDREIIVKAARDTGTIVTIEDHSISGGLGSAVAETLLDVGITNVRFKRMGLEDQFCLGYGAIGDLRKLHGFDATAMVNVATKLLRT